MKLFRLIEGIEILRSKVHFDIDIKNICSDSRKASENSIFVAIKGLNRNGNTFIKEALEKGCSCIITDDESVYFEHENTVLTYDSRRALAVLWDNYYKNPSKKLKIIGITGTNGKTSTAFFLYNILKRTNKSVALISTVKCVINDALIDFGGGTEVADTVSAMTTPDPEILYMLLNKMVEENTEYLVMEASSHALELSKLYPIDFYIGIFTNLTPDHLDFHGSMENYFISKMKLFCKCKYAIINGDDKYGRRMPRYINRDFISYGLSKKNDYYAANISLGMDGVSYNLNYRRNTFAVKTQINGIYSVYNSMAAIVAALIMDVERASITSSIRDLKGVDGRLEKISEGIYIDYAHTPNAFEEVISCVREFSKNKKIIVLFGCGGDRDKTKRGAMGKIASEMADVVIITSDNSRSEDKEAIIGDIITGINKNKPFYVVPDRREAIELGVGLREDNILLILGKGHEKYEIDKTGKHYFCETDVIKQALKKYEAAL